MLALIIIASVLGGLVAYTAGAALSYALASKLGYSRDASEPVAFFWFICLWPMIGAHYGRRLAAKLTRSDLPEARVVK